MAGLLYDDMPNGLLHFVLLIVILGGAAAMASGRAVARTWRPYLSVPLYMVILAAVLRFLNYALFQGDILSIPGFLVALVITLAASAYGYRACRAQQMARQYSWLYQRSGPLGWTRKSA
jgi:hypothetical protein